MSAPVEGNVVEEFMLGNTLVKICDDYCRNRTQQETDEILKRIAQRALAEFNAASRMKRNK